MTIFKYEDNSRELFLGWDAEDSLYEPVFRFRNEQIVEYFDKYFDSLYRIAIPIVDITKFSQIHGLELIEGGIEEQKSTKTPT
jgi:hypothetical protein